MPGIDRRTIFLLVELGRLGETGSPAAGDLLAELADRGEADIQPPASWFETCIDLEAEDHAALVRGLALAEGVLDWEGGRGAGVIWTFRDFRKRHPDSADALADWVLARSDNEYAPFGSSNLGARSMAEYRAKFAQRVDRRAQSLAERREREEAVERRRAARRAANREADLRRRDPGRAAFLASLEGLTLVEALARAAADGERPIGHYPTRVADAVRADLIAALPPDLRTTLWERLRGRHRGPWGVFKKRLASCLAAEEGRGPP